MKIAFEFLLTGVVVVAFVAFCLFFGLVVTDEDPRNPDGSPVGYVK